MSAIICKVMLLIPPGKATKPLKLGKEIVEIVNDIQSESYYFLYWYW